MRQIPTTGSRDFGSAPAVSLEKSALKSGAANAGHSRAATLTVAAISNALVPPFMTTSLRSVGLTGGKRRLRHHARAINVGRMDRNQTRANAASLTRG